MKILCIDPGKMCGAVILDTSESPPKVLEIWPGVNIEPLLSQIYLNSIDAVAIETIISYGMPMDNETLRTVEKIGQVVEACRRRKRKLHRMTRPEVCVALCGSTKAKKANVSQAVRNRYPATGGGATPEVGKKGQPGPLYGVKLHAWDALALGIAVTQ
jgi:Holliday junction resolvasome RuvABC endonuclease subunit